MATRPWRVTQVAPRTPFRVCQSLSSEFHSTKLIVFLPYRTSDLLWSGTLPQRRCTPCPLEPHYQQQSQQVHPLQEEQCESSPSVFRHISFQLSLRSIPDTLLPLIVIIIILWRIPKLLTDDHNYSIQEVPHAFSFIEELIPASPESNDSLSCMNQLIVQT